MNVIPSNEHLYLKGINSDGQSFVVADRIGFSEGDTMFGFNRDSSSYIDSEGVEYDRLNEVVLLFYAYLNKYAGSRVPASVTSQIIRASSDAVDYDSVAYNGTVEVVGDGWYTIHGFLLPVNTGVGIHYNTATGQIMLDTEPLILDQLVDMYQDGQMRLDLLITPGREMDLNTRVGDLADTGKQKGPASKEYKQQQRAVQFIDGQLYGARVMFEEGHRYEAQETIEDLETGNPFTNI